MTTPPNAFASSGRNDDAAPNKASSRSSGGRGEEGGGIVVEILDGLRRPTPAKKNGVRCGRKKAGGGRVGGAQQKAHV